MRVLLIHQAYSGPDDPGGTRHFELGQRLAAEGYQFSIVTSRYSYLGGEPKAEARKTKNIDVYFAPTLAGLHKSYPHRVAALLSFMVTSPFAAFRSGSPDVVMGTSPPIFQAISAWIIALLRRRPFLLELRDLWPEFAIDLGILRNRPLIFTARAIERLLYRFADHIVVNSPAYREYLLARGVSDEKISIVPNGVDASKFHPESQGFAFRSHHKLAGKFVVMYAGALGVANDIDCLLRAASHLQDEPRITLALVGSGKELPRLKLEVRSMQLNNVVFAGPQPKELMPEVLAAADVCIATLAAVPILQTTYPNKVFDYMAAGRPTILAIDGIIRGVIERSAGGVFVPPGDDFSMAEEIRKLHNSPELRRQMGMTARAYVEQHFNRAAQARQLAEIFLRVKGGEISRSPLSAET